MVNMPGRLSREHHDCEVNEQEQCEIIEECKRVAEFYKVEPNINEDRGEEHKGTSDE